MLYCITRKEVLAVVLFHEALQVVYLLGRRFRVRTDHAALTWLRKTAEPIGQQARWLEQMEEYDFDIEHRRGARPGNVDAMSCRPCEQKGCVCRQVMADVSTSDRTDSRPPGHSRMANSASSAAKKGSLPIASLPDSPASDVSDLVVNAVTTRSRSESKPEVYDDHDTE